MCAVHVGLGIGPEYVPPHKAGLRALTQQVLLTRIREGINNQDELARLRQEGTQGASFSVETQWDHVEFVASATSSQLPTLLEYMARAIFEATWSQDDIVNAREMIVRDKLANDGGMGPASENAFHLFRRALVGDSPLAQPIFGTEKTLQSVTLADVKSFYRSYYVPNLTAVCVVSPLPAGDATDLARRSFGHLKSRKVARTESIRLGADQTKVELGISPELNHAVVVVGIPVPPMGSKEFAIAEVVHASLSGPRGAFALDEELASSVPTPSRPGAGPVPPATVLPIPMSRAPYLAAFGRTLPTAVDDLRKGILRHLLKLSAKPMSEAELHRAKTRAINAHMLPMDTPVIAATILSRRFLLTDKFDAGGDFATQVAELSAEDVQAFAKTHFVRHAVGVMMPGS